MTPLAQIVEFHLAPDSREIGQRLDKAITDWLAEYSRARLQQLIKEGYVFVNGKPAKSSLRLEDGDSVAVHLETAILTPNAAVNTEPEAIPLHVLYEDDDLAALDKPAGLVVHPAAGHARGTLVNAILARWPQVAQVGGEGRAGIVHRLDKDTSGVILIAKTESARLYLMTQFEARQVQKRYLALVEGTPKTPTGDIVAPIGRDPQERKRMAVQRQGGREASTFYRVLRHFQHDQLPYTLLETFPKTGRTHQIRVHLAYIGLPIVGDTVYGRRKVRLGTPRHFLHAESIQLTLPTGSSITIHAPLPADLQTVLALLEAQSEPL